MQLGLNAFHKEEAMICTKYKTEVIIRNAKVGPIVDEFAEIFTSRAIYSIGDLYSGYDQFQLVVDS